MTMARKGDTFLGRCGFTMALGRDDGTVNFVEVSPYTDWRKVLPNFKRPSFCRTPEITYRTEPIGGWSEELTLLLTHHQYKNLPPLRALFSEDIDGWWVQSDQPGWDFPV